MSDDTRKPRSRSDKLSGDRQKALTQHFGSRWFRASTHATRKRQAKIEEHIDSLPWHDGDPDANTKIGEYFVVSQGTDGQRSLSLSPHLESIRLSLARNLDPEKSLIFESLSTLAAFPHASEKPGEEETANMNEATAPLKVLRSVEVFYKLRRAFSYELGCLKTALSLDQIKKAKNRMVARFEKAVEAMCRESLLSKIDYDVRLINRTLGMMFDNTSVAQQTLPFKERALDAINALHARIASKETSVEPDRVAAFETILELRDSASRSNQDEFAKVHTIDTVVGLFCDSSPEIQQKTKSAAFKSLRELGGQPNNILVEAIGAAFRKLSESHIKLHSEISAHCVMPPLSASASAMADGAHQANVIYSRTQSALQALSDLKPDLAAKALDLSRKKAIKCVISLCKDICVTDPSRAMKLQAFHSLCELCTRAPRDLQQTAKQQVVDILEDLYQPLSDRCNAYPPTPGAHKVVPALALEIIEIARILTETHDKKLPTKLQIECELEKTSSLWKKLTKRRAARSAQSGKKKPVNCPAKGTLNKAFLLAGLDGLANDTPWERQRLRKAVKPSSM